MGQQYLIKIQIIEYKFGTVNLHIHASHEITAVTKGLNSARVACRLPRKDVENKERKKNR